MQASSLESHESASCPEIAHCVLQRQVFCEKGWGEGRSLAQEVVSQHRAPPPVPGARVQLDAALLHVQRAAHVVIPAPAQTSGATLPTLQHPTDCD